MSHDPVRAATFTTILARVAARAGPHPLTRFAPAPTGRLHLGHVLNAKYVWGIARRVDGRVLLRIEDHDRARCRPEFELDVLDTLDWLGFAADVYPTSSYRAGRCDGRQSDRDSIYRAALEALAARGLVYACDCSRRLIQQTRAAGDEPRYTGRCRTRGLPLADGYGWRVRMDPGLERFVDVRLGEQVQSPADQCGDVLVRDRDGHWTYQFAVTVDDCLQQIDFVVRGVDLLGSTGRQIRLARLLGRERPPVFLHHPLMMKSPTQKLSKSDRDTGIADLRARGWSRDDVLAAARIC
ncbi:MAG TPA: glutamate--tRNA ligase family protein [Vicinamibacterales bacterium]|nr:glutamate--tRNA ligase family protein [Vicinamibacterales bacterium]